ncbi:TatD family hydrolase [Flavobacteriales bacterium]|jgi:TatD DNase family protein|nr:TatD family hydrolase [Flavobacteriales bacterium]
MKLIDTHTHVFLEQFDEDFDQVIARALESGVEKMLLPNIDSSTLERLLMNSNENQLLPMMGLHPCSVKDNYEEELELVANEIESGKYIAVGEIGIDLYWDQSLKAQQIDAFKRQIELAKKYDLPVAIHTREAFDEVFDALDETHDGALRGVFHCFTGNEDQAKKALSYSGFYLGLGGVLTFKKSGLDKVVKDIPLDRLLLETDAPYLAPTPFRGKRNEPSYLVHIAQKLADIHEMSIEKVAEITTKNANDLFRL